MANPREALDSNRRAAQRLVDKLGVQRVEKLLHGSQRELEARLRTMSGGARTFTREQMKATLAQVRTVLQQTTIPGIRDTVVDAAPKLGEHVAVGTMRYLEDAEQHFRGVGAQPLALDEVAVLDAGVAGAEATVLRRLASGGTDEPGATEFEHRAKAGILERYGMNTIAAFEETLQKGMLQRKSFADMRADLIEQSPFLQGKPMFWATRIARTELMGAENRAAFEAQRQSNEQLGDMLKILAATFDNRTAADSYAVHGQIRRPEEAFETWQGLMQHPPARPNDREIVVPHRMSWPLPPYLAWKTDEQIAMRWRMEGRKGAHPPRPLMTTVPLARIGSG